MRWTCVLVMMSAAVVGAQTTQPKVTESAQPIVEQVRTAYAGLKSLDLAGTLTLDLDIAGQRESHSEALTGWFHAPASFKHELAGDLMLVSDGKKAFAYKIDQKRYTKLDAPADRIAGSGDVPSTIWLGLQQQNPSLLLALSKDAAAILSSGAGTIDHGEDVTLDGKVYPALTFTADEQAIRILIDPASHLIRQYSIDMKQQLTKHGVSGVNSATVRIDYTKSTTGVELADAGFNWTPPAEALMIKLVDESQGNDPGGGGSEAGQVLAGKPAPAFSLKDLDGNAVSLEKLQGSVVVLDFWATWCGPCIMSMPHIDQLNKDMADKGVKVFAVNYNEQAGVVKTFLTAKNFTMPVLLDSDGKVSSLYKAPPIPQTFIIGKDGKVRKVFVGYGPGVEKTIHEAVEAAMKE